MKPSATMRTPARVSSPRPAVTAVAPGTWSSQMFGHQRTHPGEGDFDPGDAASQCRSLPQGDLSLPYTPVNHKLLARNKGRSVRHQEDCGLGNFDRNAHATTKLAPWNDIGLFYRVVAERVQCRHLGEVESIYCQRLLFCQLALIGIDRSLKQGVMI